MALFVEGLGVAGAVRLASSMTGLHLTEPEQTASCTHRTKRERGLPRKVCCANSNPAAATQALKRKKQIVIMTGMKTLNSPNPVNPKLIFLN